ncbi:hypothetical protein SFC43_13675 [Bacteroides sp. CR5/BHMF/2]|nr:hypothetical protein [Bacteroides sp. CR5/BHMF/2]
MDYLINISAFAARYNPRRVFEVIAIGGISYQATMKTGMETIHSTGCTAACKGNSTCHRHSTCSLSRNWDCIPTGWITTFHGDAMT